MGGPTVVYTSRHGIIIAWEHPRIAEVQWLRTTRSMTGIAYVEFMDEFLIEVEGSGAPGALVDETHLRIPPLRRSAEWFASEFTPRCNAAGLKKLATVNPARRLAQASEAAFAQHAFGSRDNALAWLT